jgi:hypothetical protein
MTDKNCPYIEYLFDNGLRATTGAYRCPTQGLQPEDANYKTWDYPICYETNHKECSIFLRRNKLEKSIFKKKTFINSFLFN